MVQSHEEAKSPMKILIVDDEQAIIDILAYNLKRAHYEVITAHDGESAIRLALSESPDLLILDLMLPVLDGLEVFKRVRQSRDVPIIMLTALDAEIDRVVGLELGADDYVVKPFSVRELMARVKNILRRGTSPTLPTTDCALKLDVDKREAMLSGQLLDLTMLEFELLHILYANRGHVFSREKLLEVVWGYDYAGDLRAVDAAVKRLRQKLALAAPDSDLIATVRGIGYKLSES
jgi:DNA-binding response OmpR family regulator